MLTVPFVLIQLTPRAFALGVKIDKTNHSGLDLNTAEDRSLYLFSTAGANASTNKPTGAGYGLVYARYNSNRGFQIYINIGTPVKIWIRTLDDGNWGGWSSVQTNS